MTEEDLSKIVKMVMVSGCNLIVWKKSEFDMNHLTCMAQMCRDNGFTKNIPIVLVENPQEDIRFIKLEP